MRKVTALASAAILALAIAVPASAAPGENNGTCLGELRSTQSGEVIGTALGARGGTEPWTHYGQVLKAWKAANC